jgi:hypothetical protein
MRCAGASPAQSKIHGFRIIPLKNVSETASIPLKNVLEIAIIPLKNVQEAGIIPLKIVFPILY